MRSKLGYTHVWSDPHYYHTNIIGYCNRPFYSTAHQVDEMSTRFNVVVGPDDHALCLGDLFLNASTGHELMRRLNGRKSLVCGNHDLRLTDAKLKSFGFELVERGSLLDEIDGVTVRWCHYPYASDTLDDRYLNLRPPNEAGVVLIHGHTHGQYRITRSHALHVGVDAWDYAPVSIQQLAPLVHECAARRFDLVYGAP